MYATRRLVLIYISTKYHQNTGLLITKIWRQNLVPFQMPNSMFFLQFQKKKFPIWPSLLGSRKLKLCQLQKGIKFKTSSKHNTISFLTKNRKRLFTLLVLFCIDVVSTTANNKNWYIMFWYHSKTEEEVGTEIKIKQILSWYTCSCTKAKQKACFGRKLGPKFGMK